MTSLYDAYTLLSENRGEYNNDTAWAPAAAALTQATVTPTPRKSTPLQQQQAAPPPPPLPQQQRPVVLPLSPTTPAAQQLSPIHQEARASSYADLMSAKRRDMIKVVGSALMIIFALALYLSLIHI